MEQEYGLVFARGLVFKGELGSSFLKGNYGTVLKRGTRF